MIERGYFCVSLYIVFKENPTRYAFKQLETVITSKLCINRGKYCICWGLFQLQIGVQLNIHGIRTVYVELTQKNDDPFIDGFVVVFGKQWSSNAQRNKISFGYSGNTCYGSICCWFALGFVGIKKNLEYLHFVFKKDLSLCLHFSPRTQY